MNVCAMVTVNDGMLGTRSKGASSRMVEDTRSFIRPWSQRSTLSPASVVASVADPTISPGPIRPERLEKGTTAGCQSDAA